VYEILKGKHIFLLVKNIDNNVIKIRVPFRSRYSGPHGQRL